MKKELNVKNLIAILLSVMMIIGAVAFAADNKAQISSEEIDAILNTTTDSSQISSPFIEVSDKVRDSVVGINNYQIQRNNYYNYYGFGFGYGYGYGNRGNNNESQETLYAKGSGVVVSPYGHILTNYHVIENGRQITLYLSNGQKQPAKVVWTDPSSDLAMLKTDANIPYLAISGGGYKSGDEVVAIGTPIDLAFKHTATKGIISATNRTIVVDNNFGQSTLYDLIQHDASINPGNSGGPLVNMNGEVVGINTVKVTDAEGLGFAIPADTFKPVVEKISATGGYQTTYLGVFGYDSQLKDFSNTSGGYYVQSVAKNSPASLNGIEQGDIITRVGKKNITLARDLKTALYDYDIGDVVRVVVVRNGVEKFFDVELTSRP